MNARKKLGLVVAGVVTAGLAASPLAWAADEPPGPPEDCSFSRTGDDVVSGTAGPQSPQASNNQGISGRCSTFDRSDDGRGTGVGNTVNGQEVPALPGLPG